MADVNNILGPEPNLTPSAELVVVDPEPESLPM